VVPSLPVTVTCVASVATTVNIEVCATATVVGLAEIVIVGTLRILLPTKRAHPEHRVERTVKTENRRGVEIRRVVCSVCKLLSIFFPHGSPRYLESSAEDGRRQ
jgi:mannose/fructose/N-acetylgalactosamine-specific phosphotransferase system component IIC